MARRFCHIVIDQLCCCKAPRRRPESSEVCSAKHTKIAFECFAHHMGLDSGLRRNDEQKKASHQLEITRTRLREDRLDLVIVESPDAAKQSAVHVAVVVEHLVVAVL